MGGTTPGRADGRLRPVLPALCALVLLLACAAARAAEPPIPAPAGYVTDAAGVMGPWAAKTEELCRDVEKRTSVEIAVLTVRTTGQVPLVDYAQSVFDRWKIGKKGASNGVLIVVAVDDRRMRIHTGYGVEGTLPDGKVGEIRDRLMLPEFRQGNFGEGIYLGTAYVAKILAGEKAELPARGRRAGKVRLAGIVLLVILGLLALPSLFAGPFASWRRRGGYYGGGFWGGYGGGGFGGGFGGGGFGGFGGGSSGGGGAGGSW